MAAARGWCMWDVYSDVRTSVDTLINYLDHAMPCHAMHNPYRTVPYPSIHPINIQRRIM